MEIFMPLGNDEWMKLENNDSSDHPIIHSFERNLALLGIPSGILSFSSAFAQCNNLDYFQAFCYFFVSCEMFMTSCVM